MFVVIRNLRYLLTVNTNNAQFVNNVHPIRFVRGLPKVRVEILHNADQEPVAAHSSASTDSELNPSEPTQHGLRGRVARESQLKTPPTQERTPATHSFPEEQLMPTFNLAAYVNKSHTLQQFIKLGVDLHKIERRKGLPQFVLNLDFEKNVQPYLLFLSDQGVPAEAFGELITKNPLLFKEHLDDLQTRINYLEAKKFTPIQRQRILTHNPYWLMYSTQRIDRRLGHFQQEFQLSGNDIRFLASKQPRLITYKMAHIRQSTFCIREEMGFSKDEVKCLLLSKPRLWMMNSDELIERFAYAHEKMELSHNMLLQFPEVLVSREFRLRQRHEFLKLLGRAQYDPEKDLYVSPRTVVEGTDYEFVRNVAKSDMKTYELFLKTR